MIAAPSHLRMAEEFSLFFFFFFFSPFFPLLYVIANDFNDEFVGPSYVEVFL